MPDFWDSIPNASTEDFWGSLPDATEANYLQDLGITEEELGPKPTGREMLEGAKAGAKGVAALATGAVSWIPAVLATPPLVAMKAIEGVKKGDVLKSLLEVSNTPDKPSIFRDISDFWSYIPDDPGAQDVVNVGAAPFEGVRKVAGKWRDTAQDIEGLPEWLRGTISIGGATAIESAPYLLPFLVGGGVRTARAVRGNIKSLEGLGLEAITEGERPVLARQAKEAIQKEATTTGDRIIAEEQNRELMENLAGRVDEAESHGMVVDEKYKKLVEEQRAKLDTAREFEQEELRKDREREDIIAKMPKADDVVIYDMVGQLENGIAGSMVHDNTGAGWETTVTKSGYPDWARRIAKEHRKSYAQVLTAFKKGLAGDRLSLPEVRIFNSILRERDIVAKDPAYAKIRDEIDLLENGFEPREKVVGGELAVGDEVMREGERYRVTGEDGEGNIILKDGETITIDPFDKLRVEGVKKGRPEAGEGTTLSFFGMGEAGKMGHIVAPATIGSAAGIETDEQGRLTYNPTKGLIGAAGLTIAPQAMRPLKAVGRAVGETGPGKAWREFWKPLSTIPESERYLGERYKSLGDVDRAERLADKTHKRLDKLTDDQKKTVFRFLDGQLDEVSLTPDIAPLAKTLQTVNTMIGRMLVKRGLLSEETFNANKGRYIRYLYLKHILGDKLSGFGQGGAKMDMSYLKQRKDLSPEQRKAIGWIEDVSIAEPVSIMKPLGDIARYDFMEQIAGNDKWTWQPSIVEVGGKKMTVGKLAEELTNQEAVAKQMPDVPEVQERLTVLRTAMEEAKAVTGNVPEGYVQLNGRQYGPLDGAFVKKPIARDLKPVVDIPTDFHSSIVNGLINLERKGMAAFKVGKVAFNLPTVVRNIGSNFIQLNMSGIPMTDIPVHFTKALRSMLKKDAVYREGIRRGLFKTNWSASEINEILHEVRAWEGKSWYNITPRLRNLAKYYGRIDDIAKLTKFTEQIGKGVAYDKAAIEAQKWGMDYSLAHPFIKTARRHVLPFVSYQAKILPLITETMLNRPWIVAKYAMIPYLMTQFTRDNLNLTDQEWTKLKRRLPVFIKNSQSYMPLPVRSKEGNVQWVDAQYFFPWGSMGELLNSAVKGDAGGVIQESGIGNPFLSMAIVAKTMHGDGPPKDPFTGQEVYNRLDSPTDKAIKSVEWIYNLWAPTMLQERGALGFTARVGEKDKYGREVTPAQAAGRWVGVNIASPTERQYNITKRAKLKELRSSIFKKIADPTVSQAEKERARAEYYKQVQEYR